jgi:hypothetical protein
LNKYLSFASGPIEALDVVLEGETMNSYQSRNFASVTTSDECPQLNHRLEYKVRVRGTAAPGMCLWGSAGITGLASFTSPPLLHIRNDKHGEVLTFGTQAKGTQSVIGTLQPGECFSIQLQGISGVFAYCVPATGSGPNPELESTVYCAITAK